MKRDEDKLENLMATERKFFENGLFRESDKLLNFDDISETSAEVHQFALETEEDDLLKFHSKSNSKQVKEEKNFSAVNKYGKHYTFLNNYLLKILNVFKIFLEG